MYLFKKVGHSRPLLIYFRLFNTVDNKQVNQQMFKYKFADDWSQTPDLWYQKRPLYQPSHNHFPTANYLIASQCIFYLSFEKKIPLPLS